MLAHRLRRWINIKPTLVQRLVLAGISLIMFGGGVYQLIYMKIHIEATFKHSHFTIRPHHHDYILNLVTLDKGVFISLITLILLITTIVVFNSFIIRPNHCYWEGNECLNINICPFLVSN